MRIFAVVEITPGPNGNLPSDLVAAAYRASSNARVMFALNDVSPKEVDRILDPIIRNTGPQYVGVVYANINEEKVLSAARAATAVVSVSRAFTEKLMAAGIAAQNWESSSAVDWEAFTPALAS